MEWLLDDDDEAIEEVEAGIRQGIRDMIEGRTYPIETLWDGLEEIEA